MSNQFEIVMPKMGESVQEATITKWFVSVGDMVEEDTALAEIATDKVDSEIPSPVDGKVVKILFNENDTVAVGEVIAIISLDGEMLAEEEEEKDPKEGTKKDDAAKTEEKTASDSVQKKASTDMSNATVDTINATSSRFYSPLVKSIAKKEGLTVEELESVPGSGKEDRVRKEDILQYIENKGKGVAPAGKEKTQPGTETPDTGIKQGPQAKVQVNEGDEVVEMDRIRKIIADHMVHSKHTAPHVTSVVEADVSGLVLWRNKVKDQFQQKQGEKITFMPLFIEATAKALRDFPRVNASIDGTNMILRKNVNIGIAVALENGNLVVPVIKNADQKNLVGLTTEMNRLAKAARTNKLKPEEIQGGTFSITNFGSFQNIIGTPIINQPQVAILATGSIEKKPAVIESPLGDTIGIRHKMYLSLSYDHRIVDGALGGAFLKRIKDYLEGFNTEQSI